MLRGAIRGSVGHQTFTGRQTDHQTLAAVNGEWESGCRATPTPNSNQHRPSSGRHGRRTARSRRPAQTLSSMERKLVQMCAQLARINASPARQPQKG
jgi:hypothetical protein